MKTFEERKAALRQAEDLIFSVEKSLPYESEIRREGYRTRIKLGLWQDALRLHELQPVTDPVVP